MSLHEDLRDFARQIEPHIAANEGVVNENGQRFIVLDGTGGVRFVLPEKDPPPDPGLPPGEELR